MPSRVAILSLVMLVGSVSSTQWAQSAAPQPAARALRAELAAITGRCGLPKSALRLNSDGGVRFRPRLDARYAQVVCVLTELRRRGVDQRLPIAFVGDGPVR